MLYYELYLRKYCYHVYNTYIKSTNKIIYCKMIICFSSFTICYFKWFVQFIFIIRLKSLISITSVLIKISYMMITLMRYKSFKLNIIKINININLNHKRIMSNKESNNIVLKAIMASLFNISLEMDNLDEDKHDQMYYLLDNIFEETKQLVDIVKEKNN